MTYNESMLGYNFFKIIHLCSIVILSGLVLTGGRDQKVSVLKWIAIVLSTIALGASGVLLLANLGFVSSGFPLWVYLKMTGFFLLLVLSLMGLKKLWSEKVVFSLWIIFSIALIVISVNKYY